ncbi:MAG: TetR/AcrR family transcriptional regulator [Bacteroidia bacterium]|nr:TetR/AcrR family transcriptional regulator [Bacteroidia bacterium]
MVKEKRDNQTEKAILEAADKVFTRKGFAAARMEDIAKEAGINRALLHYYFRSKEKMFDLIFDQRVREFFSGLGEIIGSEKNLEEKIRAIIEHEITILIAHPYLPIFVLQEVNQNPQRMLEHAQKAGAHPSMLLKKFSVQVKDDIKKQIIRPIDPSQLLMNIMSMAIYPFIAKPILKTILETDDTGFEVVMKRRKKEVTEFILQALKV